MPKKQVDTKWFEWVRRERGLNPTWAHEVEWLKRLETPIEKIANFGCMTGSEPFALLWTLNASEVYVIEREERFLEKAKNLSEGLAADLPDSLLDRQVRPVLADMCKPIKKLPTAYFDLAYCRRVLYIIQDRGENDLKAAIAQMVRVVKPGGMIVAVERTDLLIRPLFEFEDLGLVRQNPSNTPSDSLTYCYKKITS